ncbi:MAG: Restriction endonuclease S subunit (modular protein) [Candidatus Nitrospira kreftii]|uniref:Restriction endonuclease S subunit (Modular protein) n=1 Tax=Candidatus Nitrospira kreftii TaxID=2652173 RepID=A0A7S8FBX8_9BACT|nr:MAG: Restriction endonuclease S subunit (modular protein) [Candidatus Nitrospira kreftii]
MAEFSRVAVSKLVAAGEAELKTGPFGTQLKASDYTEEGTPVINVRNIGFGGIKADKLEYISPSTRNRLSSHILQRGDIVFGRKGAVERHVFIREEQDGWFQGSDCLRLRFTSPRVEPLFASYFFLTPEHQRWMMNQCSHGATMASLNQEILERIELPLPPLLVQRQIASILSAYDELIENNQRRIKILEEMARSLYREWFVHFRFPGHDKVKMVPSRLGSIPYGWEACSIDDICELVTDGSHSSPKSVEEGLPMASSKDMHEWGLNLDTCRHISRQDFDQLVRNGCKPKKNDVLITKDGANYLKHIFVVREELELVLLSSIAILRPNKRINPHLLTAILSDPDNKGRLKNYVTGAAIPRIILSDFKLFKIVLPSQEVQDAWAKIAEPITQLCWTLIDQITNLRRTRDLLLPRLLPGELSVKGIPVLES